MFSLWTIPATIVGICLLACSVWAEVGAAAYKGKDPIGGGAGYTRLVGPEKAAFTVSSLDELIKACKSAKSGDVIYIADGTEIDCTGTKNITIPGGVALAGNRGAQGSVGPLIKTTDLDCNPLFVTGGPKVRVTGIRLQGPDTAIRDSAYVAANSNGIRAVHPELEVENCEIWGWSHAGIFLHNAGKGARVHHCYIHHCRRAGLGYGVCLASSQANIEANRFLDNRHDIAGTGRVGTAYLASYNISETADPPISHAFDMHGNHESRKPGEVVPRFAGDSVVICYNTFKSTKPRIGILIRGEPRATLAIHNNLYENASIGAELLHPCKNGVIFNDKFTSPPTRAYYRFARPGNRVNGKRMPAGDVKELPQ